MSNFILFQSRGTVPLLFLFNNLTWEKDELAGVWVGRGGVAGSHGAAGGGGGEGGLADDLEGVARGGGEGGGADDLEGVAGRPDGLLRVLGGPAVLVS